MAVKLDNPALKSPDELEFDSKKDRAWNLYVMMMKGEKIPHRQCIIFANHSGSHGISKNMAAMYWVVALKKQLTENTLAWFEANAGQEYDPVAYLDSLPSEFAHLVAPIV